MRKTHSVNARSEAAWASPLSCNHHVHADVCAFRLNADVHGQEPYADGTYVLWPARRTMANATSSTLASRDSHAPGFTYSPMSPGSYTPQTKPRIATAMCAITPQWDERWDAYSGSRHQREGRLPVPPR